MAMTVAECVAEWPYAFVYVYREDGSGRGNEVALYHAAITYDSVPFSLSGDNIIPVETSDEIMPMGGYKVPRKAKRAEEESVHREIIKAVEEHLFVSGYLLYTFWDDGVPGAEPITGTKTIKYAMA